MSRQKKVFKTEKKNDKIYLPSLKALVDVLFQEAFDRKWNWSKFAEESGLSYSCVKNLGLYQTRYPMFRTVQLLAMSLGGRVDFQTGKGKVKKISWTPKVFDGRRKVA